MIKNNHIIEISKSDGVDQGQETSRLQIIGKNIRIALRNKIKSFMVKEAEKKSHKAMEVMGELVCLSKGCKDGKLIITMNKTKFCSQKLVLF